MRRERLGKVNFRLDQGTLSGKLVAELELVSKSFHGKTVIDDFSCNVLRGDKVGLIGPNGVGKSTLLKLILGKLQPDSGHIQLGTKLSIAYFDQFREQLDADVTLVDSIVQGSQFVEVNGQRRHVISYLGDFLFSADRTRAKVSALSGGERNRLLLARMFTRPANALILDEPTNDLDIETLELLESLLQEYLGTVFIVSHDRAFLDNIVTQVIVFEGEGKLTEYAGAYQDWKENCVGFTGKSKITKRGEIKADENNLTKSVKLTFKDMSELENIPDEISALEEDQRRITDILSNSNLYRDNPEKVKMLKGKFSEIQKLLTEKMSRWEELETKKLRRI